MIVCILRVLLGLGSVLFALGMIILAVSFCGCAMGLCSGFVMFRRLVVCIFHFVFSCWPTNCGNSRCGLNSGRTKCRVVHL